MSTAKVELEKRQARYKNNLDNRIGTPKEDIAVECHVFIRKDYFNPKKERRHKLSPVVTGPYLVRHVDKHTVVLEIEDKTRERVSRDRVVLAPSPSGVIIRPGARTEGEDDGQYGNDTREDTTTPSGEAVFDGVTPTGDVAETSMNPYLRMMRNHPWARTKKTDTPMCEIKRDWSKTPKAQKVLKNPDA